MNTEMIGIIVTFAVTLLIAFPLGKYISKVLKGERTFTDFLNPVERAIFRFCGINPATEMNWKQHLVALLSINALWFVYAFFMLLFQGSMFLNPDGNPSMSADLSFNTAISFLVNCNLQHYSGETGLTYLTQLAVVTFLQFVSAATGIAAVAICFGPLQRRPPKSLVISLFSLPKPITRILLPISIVIACVLVFNGTPASFEGKDNFVSLQGDTVNVSRGPAAGMIAIKHVGTNGGGWLE